MNFNILFPLTLIALTSFFVSCSDTNNRQGAEMKSPGVDASDTDHDNMPMDHDMMSSMNMSMQKMESMEMTGDFDLDYAKMMIIHHQSAIDMCEIEIAQGKHDDMKSMAQKIISEQKREIEQFQNFINNYKANSGSHTGMQHGSGDHNEMQESMTVMNTKMKGMVMTGDTDKDFAMMMIPHHEGAIAMSEAHIGHGNNLELKKLASKIMIDQKKEIDELKAWLAKHN